MCRNCKRNQQNAHGWQIRREALGGLPAWRDALAEGWSADLRPADIPWLAEEALRGFVAICNHLLQAAGTALAGERHDGRGGGG